MLRRTQKPQKEHDSHTNGFLNANYFFVCLFVSKKEKNNTAINEMQAPNFWVCPTKCKTAGHPTQVYDAASLSFRAVD